MMSQIKLVCCLILFLTGVSGSCKADNQNQHDSTQSHVEDTTMPTAKLPQSIPDTTVKTERWRTLLDSLAPQIDDYNALEYQRSSLEDSLLLLQAQIDTLTQRLRKDSLPYHKSLSDISTAASQISGSRVITYKGDKYQIFFVSNKSHDVQILPPPLPKPSTIRSIVENPKKAPLMVTNAGMFQPDYSPQGLLITDYKLMHPLDTDSSQTNGNFYLYPNGVFFIDSAGSYNILDTKGYISKNFNKGFVRFATQSGPLLIFKRRLNKNIRMNSVNRKIRSGVGMISTSQAVFIISLDEVSFYNFSMLFTNLNCTSALFLDGAISKMYIKDESQNKQKINSDFDFGPMIAVFKK